jgi:hypothetical protein
MKNRIVITLVVVLAALCLAGCFPGGGNATKEDPAGFFTGIWHGWIAPVSLVVGLFNHTIRIYEPNNVGWWYDLGFYVAIIAGFGGVAFTRKKKKKPQS